MRSYLTTPHPSHPHARPVHIPQDSWGVHSSLHLLECWANVSKAKTGTPSTPGTLVGPSQASAAADRVLRPSLLGGCAVSVPRCPCLVLGERGQARKAGKRASGAAVQGGGLYVDDDQPHAHARAHVHAQRRHQSPCPAGPPSRSPFRCTPPEHAAVGSSRSWKPSGEGPYRQHGPFPPVWHSGVLGGPTVLGGATGTHGHRGS